MMIRDPMAGPKGTEIQKYTPREPGVHELLMILLTMDGNEHILTASPTQSRYFFFVIY